MKLPSSPDWLTEAFYVAVVLDGNPRRCGTLPCWYGANVDSPLNCEGRIIASHIVKRRRVENAVAGMLPTLAQFEAGPWQFDPRCLVEFAAWDPRNAVAGCQAHDDRLDGHRMPPLVIPREKLPPAMIEFCEDWGLEFELERRFPISEDRV